MEIYDAVVERLKELCAQRHLTQNGLAMHQVYRSQPSKALCAVRVKIRESSR